MMCEVENLLLVFEHLLICVLHACVLRVVCMRERVRVCV